MSNHDGSYMLNYVIQILDQYNFFNNMDKNKKESFFEEIRKISWEFDCNPGEILEDIGEKIRICYACWHSAEDLENGICLECRKKWRKY